MRRLAVVILAFMSLQMPTGAISGQLKLLIATDEDDWEIGEDMKVNRGMLVDTFYRNVPGILLEPHRVPPKGFTAKNILAMIESLKVQPDDAIFFYFGGHGAFDPFRKKTYVMASGDMDQAVLFVYQIRDAVVAKVPRFSSIIVDCCNILRPINAGAVLPAPEERPKLIEPVPLFNRLFFLPTGTVLIESSAPREYAVILPQRQQFDGQQLHTQNRGSLFTSCLRDALNDPNFVSRKLNWLTICRQTQVKMDDEFRTVCPHK